jgi:rSAM/selenodomain-associated transferase 2
MIGSRPLTGVAVVIPVLIEPDIGIQLARVCGLSPDEVIVVDAGDGLTRERLHAFTAPAETAGRLRILTSDAGRARQMNAGARAARSDVLLFLHADTVLPPNGLTLVRDAVGRGAVWGRFDVRLSGARTIFRVIERLMNWRSALSGIATGDQAMFVRRDVFARLGGFAPIALMEDVELSRRLRAVARPARLRAPVITSSRRWERNGVTRMVLTMWSLRALYALGVSPRRLTRWYK